MTSKRYEVQVPQNDLAAETSENAAWENSDQEGIDIVYLEPQSVKFMYLQWPQNNSEPG